MKAELQIRHMLSVYQTQWVKIGFLVPPLPVSGYELNNTHLLALIFGGLRVMLNSSFCPYPHFAYLGKTLPDR